jgi:methylenetetrahydrofolate--tRNA-(uracil-5-)-methyltransferase
MTPKPIHIVGGGLAGSEAAWQAAQMGVPVVLHEMRGAPDHPGTAAHKTDGLAELVCSNSFRSDDATSNAVGVLHAEMRKLGSLIMAMGDAHQVPAGGALAVDRHGFSDGVSQALAEHPLITIERGELSGLPPEDWDSVIIATGPLTAPGLAAAILSLTGEDSLAFFDAIAPIVHFDSINMEKAWFQSRYDKVGPGGTGKDYINCAMDEALYNRFVDALIEADAHDFKDWEKDTPYFNGCLPIEVMASRGRETLRYGPMKPVGLTNPHDPDTRPYAVVQLRQDNALGTLFNLVGFQTKIKYGAQADILRMIPGLEGAGLRPSGGHAPQHLPQLAGAARQPDAAEGAAASAFCRPDHRLRRLCGVGQHRPLHRPPCRRREARPVSASPAGNNRPWRSGRPHHRRPCRR